jgi:hypothetical protein
MANTSRNISRACGKTSDEADVMLQARTNTIRVSVREVDVIHRAAGRHDHVRGGALGCRSISIGYFKSRCSASGCKSRMR